MGVRVSSLRLWNDRPLICHNYPTVAPEASNSKAGTDAEARQNANVRKGLPCDRFQARGPLAAGPFFAATARLALELAEQGAQALRGVDDPRVPLPHLLVPEPQLLHYIGTEIFRQDVGPTHQALEHPPSGRVLEIERH